MDKITGFTPASDYLCKEYDPLTALVYGKVRRYTEWGGKCSASQKRIAEELGMSARTVGRRLSNLIKDGYISALSKKQGSTTVYVPTKKIAYRTEIRETVDIEYDATSDRESEGVRQRVVGGTTESRTKIRIKKQEDTPPTEKKLSPYSKATKELEELFCAARGCPIPDWSIDPKGLNRTWSTPLGNIWKKCDKDMLKSKNVIHRAIREMMADGLTFSMPVQIYKKVDSLLADGNKPQTTPGMDALSQRLYGSG